MCDTLCILGDGVTLFAKNSDRPMSEPQVLAAFDGRGPGGGLRTQYIDIPDTGSFSTILSRPTWLWGAEHGMNEHRVAIGNEAIFTSDDASKVPAALIGMDLVRLGLERGRDAVGALEAMTELLGSYGQGGVCDETDGLSYWSSFLIADPTSAWVLETTGRTWAARPVESGAAISNRLTLRRDWTRASSDVPPGTDVASWSHPGLPTGFADTRLAAGRAFIESASASASAAPVCDPRAVAGALRDHGQAAASAPAPEKVTPDGDGWTLCLHAGETVTTASMVALLPADPKRPARAWVALGSPCASVYIPVPVPDVVSGHRPRAPLPPTVGDAEVWHRFAAVRDAVGSDAGALTTVRDELSVLEAVLWDEADDLGTDPDTWEAFGLRATRGIDGALDRLAAAGLGGAGGMTKSDR